MKCNYNNSFKLIKKIFVFFIKIKIKILFNF